MKVSALKAKTRTVPIVIQGSDGEPDETVMLTYRPGSLTIELWEELQTIANDPQGADVEAAKVFLMNEEEPLIVTWDLQEDDGSPYPCDKTHLAKLPLEFLGLMVEAIGNDSVPNTQRAGTLADGSQLRALPDPAPGGTASSEQQTDSSADPGS